MAPVSDQLGLVVPKKLKRVYRSKIMFVTEPGEPGSIILLRKTELLNSARFCP